MNNILPVVLYILLLSVVGFFFLNLLWPKTLNTFEKIGASFGAGLIINFINSLLFSLVSVRLTATGIFLALLAWLIVLFLILNGKKKIPEIFKIKREGEFDIWSLLLVVATSLVLLLVTYKTLAVGFNSWDEFSFWGKASKAVQFTGSVFIQPAVTVGASSNPVFLPTSAGSISIVSGYFFAENFAKLITPLSLIFLCIFLFGYFRRLKLTINESLLFLLILLTSSQKFINLSTILYADVTLVYFYTLGTLTLMRLLFEEFNNNIVYYALLFLLVVPFIKKGGEVSVLISLFAVFVVLLPRLFRDRRLKTAIAATLVIIVAELISTGLSKYGGEMASPFPAKLFQYTKEAIPMIPQLVKVMIQKLTDIKTHTIFWPLATFALLVGAFISRRKMYFSIFIIAVLNVGYVFAATISLFSIQEVRTMAGFERYVVQFLPIYFLAIVLFYLDLKGVFEIKLKEVK